MDALRRGLCAFLPRSPNSECSTEWHASHVPDEIRGSFMVPRTLSFRVSERPHAPPSSLSRVRAHLGPGLRIREGIPWHPGHGDLQPLHGCLPATPPDAGSRLPGGAHHVPGTSHLPIPGGRDPTPWPSGAPEPARHEGNRLRPGFRWGLPLTPIPARKRTRPGSPWTKEFVETLVGYDRAVYLRFERAVQRWGWKAATQNRGIGHGSIKDTLVHILNVREAWLVAVAQGDWAIFDDPARKAAMVTSWSHLRRYREGVWEGEDRLRRDLDDLRLRRTVKAPWMPGRYRLGDAFLQASLEQAHHLGEIIGVFWQCDRKPPEMTWILNRPAP